VLHCARFVQLCATKRKSITQTATAKIKKNKYSLAPHFFGINFKFLS